MISDRAKQPREAMAYNFFFDISATFIISGGIKFIFNRHTFKPWSARPSATPKFNKFSLKWAGLILSENTRLFEVSRTCTLYVKLSFINFTLNGSLNLLPINRRVLKFTASLVKDL